MKLCRLLILIGLVTVASPLIAQIEVELSFDSTVYLKYEPIMAHVKISNLAGYTIGLFNHNGKPWLSFYVSRTSGEQVDEMGVEYDLKQAQIAGGDTLTMHVNLTPVYNIRAPGIYRVMVTVNSASHDKQFRTNVRQFDLTTGRDLWKGTISLRSTNAPLVLATVSTNPPFVPPPDEEVRSYVLVAKHLDRSERLYARIEEESKNTIHGMIGLGVLVGFGKPVAMVDRNGHLHVMHQVGSRAFAYAEISPDGKLIMQRTYSNMKSKPELRTGDDGMITVAGGEQTYPNPAILPLPREAAKPDTPLPEDTVESSGGAK